MAQFIIGFASGIYIGTHYNCGPVLSFASDTLEKYCPKRELDGEQDKATEDEIKEKIKEKIKDEIKEKGNDISSFKKWF